VLSLEDTDSARYAEKAEEETFAELWEDAKSEKVKIELKETDAVSFIEDGESPEEELSDEESGSSEKQGGEQPEELKESSELEELSGDESLEEDVSSAGGLLKEGE